MLIYYCAKIIVDQDGVPIEGIEGAVGTIVKRGDTGTVPEIFEDQAGTAIIAGSQLTVTQRKFVRAFYIDEAFGPVSFWGAGVEMPLETTEGIAILLGQYRVETDARLDGVEAVAAGAVATANSAQAAVSDLAQQVEDSSTIEPGGSPGQFYGKRSTTDFDAGWFDLPSNPGGPGGSTILGAPAVWPSTFPPEGHSHLVDQLRRLVGGNPAPLAQIVLEFLALSDPQALRQKIGAGTGNGTSDLKLGTTQNDAASATHLHTGVYMTPAEVEAYVNARIGSGGSGTKNIDVWRYASGAWPALPLVQPAGLSLLFAIGPTQPTVIPSWAGVGAGQVVILFNGVPLT